MDISGIDPSDQGQKDAFLNGLSQFLNDKGRFTTIAPNLAGRIIDLHDLYNRVTSAGGYQKVTDRGFWEDFLEPYGFNSISVTLAYGLQKIYQTYLEDYEKVHFFGDDDITPSTRNFYSYRRFRYPISELQRMQNNMNVQKPCVSDYDRVVLSLESCLPNEIDFAVNACTLLSGESRHVLRLPQCRRIVDALLLHAGIVSEGHDSYAGVLEELQSKTKHDFSKFWRSSVTKKSILSVLLPPPNSDASPRSEREDCEIIHGKTATGNDRSVEDKAHEENVNFAHALQKRLLAIQRTVLDHQNKDLDTEPEKNNSTSKWSELFHGHRSLGIQDYEGQRVLQIALVLLNLSFEDFNILLLAHHPSLLRFIFLCIHSQYSCLRQTGLDILSNISSHIQVLHIHYDVAAMIFDTIHNALLSEDKFERIRGFEILGNICRSRINTDYVCVSVCDEVYEAAIENLLVADVELLLSAIEALYRLSKLGETTCTKIIFVRGCIDILMCLVTLNVRTFGPEKLSEIRLARRISPGQQQQAQQQHGYATPLHPQSVNPPPGGLIPRQLHYQHSKLGSVHQAQPTVAPVASNYHPPPPVLHPPPAVRPQQPVGNPVIRPPVKQNVPTQPPNPATPAPNPPSVSPNQPTQHSTPPHAKHPPSISSPPPSAESPSTKKSPPGAGPTYTHSEVGTVPPVFHYMPAPPPEIVQDNSPESFTKLWIWATYEFEAENYIPRVDVYCEYLASSNRYGRQGKTEVLSATDFGKCLKQIFPQASSRLFNQGRGQPQYHIAGIKKRATPLPVPGYQLKDPVSIFSSEYEKIPTNTKNTVTVSSNGRAPSAVPSTLTSTNPTTPTTATQTHSNTNTTVTTASASVPIQGLQFQQVMVVPITNVSTVPTSEPTSSTTVSSTAVCNSSIPVTSTCISNCTGTSIHDSAPSESNDVSKNETPNEQSSEIKGNIATSEPSISNCENGTLQKPNCDTISEVKKEAELNDSETPNHEHKTSPESGKADSVTESNKEQTKEAALVNGFPEDDPESKENNEPQDSTNTHNIANSTPMEVEDCDGVDNSQNLKQKSSKHTQEKQQLVNGFEEESDIAKPDSPKKHVNGLNGENASAVENKNENCLKTVNVVNGQPELREPVATALVSTPCSKSMTPCVTMTTTPQVTTPSTQAADAVTPTNQVPHATLNQRLKDKITKRKNSQMTPTMSSVADSSSTTTPVNTTLPQSVLQQYSYKQTKPATEEPKETRRVLAQQIIPINPQQLQQQYMMQHSVPNQQPTVSLTYTQHNNSNVTNETGLATQTVQTGSKRPHPKSGTVTSGPVAKIPRPNPGQVQRPMFAAQSPAVHPSQVSSSGNRVPYQPGPYQVAQAPIRPPMAPDTPGHVAHHVHRPPHIGGVPNPHQVIRTNNPASQKPKQPTIDLMAPNASLLVLYRNVGKIPFANHMDEKEDAISKSVRLTASLILTNISRYSDLGRGMLQQYESQLANVAMSHMDCSPIIARLLSDMEL